MVRATFIVERSGDKCVAIGQDAAIVTQADTVEALKVKALAAARLHFYTEDVEVSFLGDKLS